MRCCLASQIVGNLALDQAGRYIGSTHPREMDCIVALKSELHAARATPLKPEPVYERLTGEVDRLRNDVMWLKECWARVEKRWPDPLHDPD